MEQELVGMWAQVGVGVGQRGADCMGLAPDEPSLGRSQSPARYHGGPPRGPRARHDNCTRDMPSCRAASVTEILPPSKTPSLSTAPGWGVNMRLIRASLPIVAHNSVYDGHARRRLQALSDTVPT